MAADEVPSSGVPLACHGEESRLSGDGSDDDYDESESESDVVMYSDVHEVAEAPARARISPQYRRSGRLCSPAVTTTLALALHGLADGGLPGAIVRRVASFVAPFEIPLFRVELLRMATEIWPRTLALEETKLSRHRRRLCDWARRRDCHCWEADEAVLRDLRLRETNIATLRENLEAHIAHLKTVLATRRRQLETKRLLGVPPRPTRM